MPAAKKSAKKPVAKRQASKSQVSRWNPKKEVHTLDINNWVLAFNTDATDNNVYLVNDIAQGTASDERVGRQCLLKSLQFHGFCYNNSTSSTNKCAIMVIWDTKPRATKPTMQDLLNVVSANGFPNVNNLERFTVLKRIDFYLMGQPGSATAITTLSYKAIDFFLDLKGRKVVYGPAGTGTIGDIEEGALYIATVGVNIAGTTAAGINFGARLRFWDN